MEFKLSFKRTVICFVLYIHICNALINNNNNNYEALDDIIDISLADYNPNNDSLQYFDLTTLLYPKSIILININEVPTRNVDFFVIQIHSFMSDVVLSSTKDFTKNSSVNGTNIGLVQLISKQVKNNNSYKFYLKSNSILQINATFVYIVVLPYYSVPIPGGCNMEFMTEIAPYQRLNYNEAVISIDAQSASIKGKICELQVVKHEMFRFYLPEADFTMATYFDSIKKMLTVQNITNYGTSVSKPLIGYLKHIFSAYKGTGSVFVIVASVNNSKSAYVPIVSYACDLSSNNSNTCDAPSSTLNRILCSLLMFIGIFVCYFGHRFFKTEMFLVGTLVGGYVSYLVFSMFDELADLDTVLLGLAIGILFGLLWVSLYHYCGIPIISTLLPLLVLGFLVSSVAFFAGLGDVPIIHNDITYWGLCISIVLGCTMILMSFMDKANILACSIVGAYAFVFPLDYYYGTSLKYIFLNTIRRVTVYNFGTAIIDPPYQWKDLVLTVLWAGMAFSGTVYQWQQQKGRPPFPPTSTYLQRPTERTPLLIHNNASP